MGVSREWIRSDLLPYFKARPSRAARVTRQAGWWVVKVINLRSIILVDK
jgi:hypothetical protein